MVESSLVDGMGAECVMSSGTTFSASNIINPYFPGSMIVSGLKTLAEGDLRSVGIQNGTAVYGYCIRTGSVNFGTTASSSGLIEFTPNFADANYYLVASPRDYYASCAWTTIGSVTPLFVSGTRRASGCWLFGPSGIIADWIAVGK